MYTQKHKVYVRENVGCGGERGDCMKLQLWFDLVGTRVKKLI